MDTLIKTTIQAPEARDAKAEGSDSYTIIERIIDGAENMNPATAARKNIFLNDSSKKEARQHLEETLTTWARVLSDHDDLDAMVRHCATKAEECEQMHEQNLHKAVEECRDLERSYRNISLFFANANAKRIRNISFVNCELSQLKDLDEPRFIDAIDEELKMNYDRLDLRNNYSILILPGYLGSNAVLEKWAKIAYEQKVMLITDFENVDEPDDLMELFDSANHTGGDIYRSNVMMTCNWLVGRGKHEEIREEEDLYVPPSGALGGKVYSTYMSQVAAGKKFGVIRETNGVKFDLKKNEVASLERLGLVPMTKDNGNVMAFSAKTLFNGNNLGLQTYSVVRVFDYVSKVLIDFLNRRAFENFNANTRKDLMAQIVKFLDSVTGPEKLIEDFTIKRFEQDSVQKDKIYVDIHMKPYFPAKNFMIKLEGQRGEQNTAWSSTYDQQVN